MISGAPAGPVDGGVGWATGRAPKPGIAHRNARFGRATTRRPDGVAARVTATTAAARAHGVWIAALRGWRRTTGPPASNATLTDPSTSVR
jgi:hypothetical protein